MCGRNLIDLGQEAAQDPKLRSAINDFLWGSEEAKTRAVQTINGASGRAVEREIAHELRYLCPGEECETHEYRNVPGEGARFIDVYTGDGAELAGTAVEVKSGRVGIDSDIRAQVRKDVALMNDPESGVVDVVWVFTASPITGRMGPTRSVANLLEENGISYIILAQ
jgi:hypothetical protein